MVATTSPASTDERKRKMTLEKARAAHLSKQLQLRLQYARLKVEHGWHKQNLNEVENLYFHHSHSRSPQISTQTSTQSAHAESSSRPSLEAINMPNTNKENARTVIPTHPNYEIASVSMSSATIDGQSQLTEIFDVRYKSPTSNSEHSHPTAMDVDQNPTRPSTPNNSVSLAAAARAYPSPTYNTLPASHNISGSSKPSTATSVSTRKSSVSTPPSTSTSPATAPPTSKSGPVPLSSLSSSFSWSSTGSQHPSSHSNSSNFTYDYNTGKTSTPVSNTLIPAPTLTYDSFWSSHSATKSVRSSFSGFSRGKSPAMLGTTGSLSSLGTSGAMSGAVDAALSLLQRRGSEGQFGSVGNVSGVGLGAPFDVPNSGGARGIDNLGSGNVAGRGSAAERASSAVGAVGVGRQ